MTILRLAEILGCTPNAVMQTGGVEDESPVRTNLQKFDLELKEGETLSLVINATVAPAQVAPEPRPLEPYKPKRPVPAAQLEKRKKA